MNYTIKLRSSLEIHPQYQDAQFFYNGLAAVKVGSKWGYINTNGEMVIEPQFHSAEPFFDDTTEVRAFGFLGLPGRKLKIDRTGNRLLNPAD